MPTYTVRMYSQGHSDCEYPTSHATNYEVKADNSVLAAIAATQQCRQDHLGADSIKVLSVRDGKMNKSQTSEVHYCDNEVAGIPKSWLVFAFFLMLCVCLSVWSLAQYATSH